MLWTETSCPLLRNVSEIEEICKSFCVVVISCTVVPRPCRTSRYPSSFNSPMALRMVVRLTLNCASSSCSEGRSVPTFRCPSVISCFNIPYTVRYNACLLIERPSFLPDFRKKIFETYPTITSYGGIVNRNTEMF